jgi:hypothetical protein
VVDKVVYDSRSQRRGREPFRRPVCGDYVQ